MQRKSSSRCSDCRNHGGYSSSSGSTSSSSTSISSDTGPLVVSSNMYKGPSKARKAKGCRMPSGSSSSSSSDSGTTAASSTMSADPSDSLLSGRRFPHRVQQDPFAWQIPPQSSSMSQSASYIHPQSVDEDRMAYNVPASVSHGSRGPGLQRGTTSETRMRNRNVESRSSSYMAPGSAVPRSYGQTLYPYHPPYPVMPQGFYGPVPDEGMQATYMRYNEPDTPDYIRLQAIFAEWERQILLGLVPELRDHEHVWSSFVKRVQSDPPLLNMRAEVQKHTERLERESAENLKTNARRQKKTVEELTRIDKSRKAYHGNPNIRAPKPKHPVPESGVPKSRL